MSATLLWAQEWPTRAVKLVVPYPAGGGVDVMARALAQKLQDKWQQAVTVDNRPGANTLLGTELVARSNDQHTLLFTTDATFTINPHLYTKLPYDLDRDFIPVTHLVSFSQMLVVNADLPANNLTELIALASRKPGSLSYASYGPGSQPQLATEMLKQKTGIFIVHIPYRGIPQAVMAVVGNEVPMTWSGIVSARPHLASKRIKAIAYGGKTRAAAYPQVPTMTELGYPEVDANVWVGLFVPSSTPAATVQKIHRDVLSILGDADFRQREVEGKSYDFVGAGPEEFKRYIARESASRNSTLKASGVKLE
ncbi:MAG: tripartite tricarboxylate transporter substrate binding protein [Betaproteobacteria bacterium]|nr:tripartite tricarboxylate transporter substrate binding protein [Betaproteobacteria bacterium]NBY71834.1 tripartite tricarboxylate transporter substrate binding protein [Betaproteobacteria bacterium]